MLLIVPRPRKNSFENQRFQEFIPLRHATGMPHLRRRFETFPQNQIKNPTLSRVFNLVQHGIEYANLLPSLTRARRAMETTFDLPERGERQVRERKKASRQVPQETIDALVSGYLDGVPTLALAKQFKLGKETVSKLLRGAGVEIRRQGLPEDKVAEAAELYRSGLTLAVVAEHYGVSVHAVYNKLRAAGVQMRDSHDRKR